GTVELQVTALEQFADGRLAAEVDLDPRDQLPHEKGLYNVVVSAELQAHDPIRLRGPRRQKDHGNMPQFRMRTNALTNIQAVGIRQHNIQNDQVRPLAAAQFQRASAGLRSSQRE